MPLDKQKPSFRMKTVGKNQKVILFTSEKTKEISKKRLNKKYN